MTIRVQHGNQPGSNLPLAATCGSEADKAEVRSRETREIRWGRGGKTEEATFGRSIYPSVDGECLACSVTLNRSFAAPSNSGVEAIGRVSVAHFTLLLSSIFFSELLENLEWWRPHRRLSPSRRDRSTTGPPFHLTLFQVSLYLCRRILLMENHGGKDYTTMDA